MGVALSRDASNENTADPDAHLRTVEALSRQCAELEERVQQLTRINTVLMDRVEREVDGHGGSYSSFQTAIALERQVKDRTVALNTALSTLERTNRELTASTVAAMAASRAKSAFLAAMSHELRTPMNGVVGMTELLLTTALDERQQRSTETIQRSALSLLRLLNDILDFSKIEAGQLEPERTVFDARVATDNVVQLLVPQIEHKQLRLSVDWSDRVPQWVFGDPTRFSQIMTNLIGNAVKFTARGSVSIAARPCDDSDGSDGSDGPPRVRFEVRDTGIGINADVVPKLFQSFFQADSSTTRQFGGTGLGLAIVHRLAALMGGSCGVTTEEGVGSCFWFELPLAVAPAPSTPLAETPRAPVPSARELTDVRERPSVPADDVQPHAERQPHILVVEDNDINQAVARGFLKALGYACTVVGNGLLAVEALTVPHAFDAVMMDWQMPVLDGLAATQRVRSHEALTGARVPIIALTANALVGDRERCIAVGMDDFLSKPFQLRELAETLARWVPRAPKRA